VSGDLHNNPRYDSVDECEISVVGLRRLWDYVLVSSVTSLKSLLITEYKGSRLVLNLRSARQDYMSGAYDTGVELKFMKDRGSRNGTSATASISAVENGS
jgi:hypothetical protein